LKQFSEEADLNKDLIPIYEELGDLKKVADKNNSIGYYYLENENYDEALQYFKRALELNEKLNNLRGKAVNLNNVGRIFEEQGKREEAKEIFGKALQILLELGLDDEKITSIVRNNLKSLEG
jgi:tetratricopeptide (TPR) repeat protein